MLNIGKMGAGSERYYLEQVARSASGYHLGSGEAPGRWLGAGLPGVGLTAGATVTGDQLRAVLLAEHPGTGVRLSSRGGRSVPGFDLTFRAPKSVSLLWAIGDNHTLHETEQAHRAAVDAAVAYLQRVALRSRRGKDGVETVEVDGLIAAGFDHRTSRDRDPLLHTHVLVANLARTSDDGRWRTLDSRRMFAHARTAGSVYQSVLRYELTARLGVAWQPVVNGTADLEGVDRAWVEGFSKRRAAILAELDRRGESSAAAAQVATLDTRQTKPLLPDTATLRDRWRQEAVTLGIPAGWHRRLLGRTTPAPVDVDTLYRRLVLEEGLTADRSSFTTRDLVRAVAEALPHGAAPDELGVAVRTILTGGVSSGLLVDLTDGDPPRSGRRWTTRPLLELEFATVDRAVANQTRQLAVADQRSLDAALATRPTMSAEQAYMVSRLTRDGAGVAVVSGRAGTGKTFALDAARHTWQHAGLQVTGTALAARAALELQESAGIRTDTIASLLRQLDDPHRSPWQPGRHVLVVDEAAMVDTRTLAQLLHAAHRHRVKVVLVGDDAQLPAIGAGGLFTALAAELPPIELTANRRQHHAWEIVALDQLRTGRADRALAAYQRHGRITTADTPDALREQLVGDWWHNATTTGTDQSVMIALRRVDVDDLNARAHRRMEASGRLWGPERRLDRDLVARAGDRIVCLRNDRTLGVLNGTRATIARIHHDGDIDIHTGRDGSVRLPASYVDDGHLTLGYAVTGHKAQGLTVDHTHVLGSDTLYREWGYVAMSRGRMSNRLYLTRAAHTCTHPPRRTDERPLDHATRRLTNPTADRPLVRSRARGRSR